MVRVEVLYDHKLETCSTTLAGGNSGPSQEEFPDLVKLVQMFSIYPTSSGGELTRYHLWPYLALMVSALPNQLRYHLQIVPE